ncbi:GSCOCG00001487001-RA-CDS [Cotesia congregata]|nr:GSCOCG00001487001-RA-CDS [Cotesia congregata]
MFLVCLATSDAFIHCKNQQLHLFKQSKYKLLGSSATELVERRNVLLCLVTATATSLASLGINLRLFLTAQMRDC